MELIADYINANRLVIPAAYYIIIYVLVLPLATLASTDNITINYPNPDGPSIFSFQKDASVSENGTDIVLTKYYDYSSGWATYHQPLHLWDPATGRVADFTSNFSFVIQAYSPTDHADGLTFFLTNGTTIPENSNGGSFALAGNTKETYDGSYPPFIAVEFDTFYESNPWDPRYEHVGIDINTIYSVANASWKWYDFTSGGKINASVMYNSSQRILTVTMIDADNASAFSTVNHSVNLKEYLPEWVTFGFSATTGVGHENHTIHYWNFVSSLEVHDDPTPPGREKNNYWLWIIIGVGSFLLLCFVLGFLWSRRRSKRNGDNPSEDENMIEPIDLEFPRVTGPRMFSFKEVASATNGFSNDWLLGEGGFGRVYKGYLREGNREVAIKKTTPDSRQGIKEYVTEVKTISQLRHKNLVQLIGWCHEKKELLLIYEFMSNGSLDTHLFNGKSLLTWEMRHKIAQGLASALLYLHEEWKECVLHRDIKASNILLDSDFTAKLGDFGLARLVDHAKGSQTTILAGTMGYMAPECTYTGKVSKESDIYSFGVVILEIASSRKVTDLIDGHIRLVDWVWKLYGIGKLQDAVDPKLEGDYDPSRMQCLMIVGLWCAHPDCNSRPTIKEALSVLNFESLPPILPSTPPVPTYADPEVIGPLSDITSSSNGGRHTTTGSSAPSDSSSVFTS